MPTFTQLANNCRKLKKHRLKRPYLQKCPQKRGTCFKVFTTNPRKPHSGERRVARVTLSTGKRMQVFVPGIGCNLQKHSAVLVRGGGGRDLPATNYSLIRGKFDFRRIETRRNARSKYGTKKVYKPQDKGYRKFRYN